MRKVLLSSPSYSSQESSRLFRACHLLIEELLREGIPLIFDATNLIERHREHLYRIADRAGAKLIIVRVDAPMELVRQRLENRSSGADSFDSSVDTSRDIAPVINKIAREANR